MSRMGRIVAWLVIAGGLALLAVAIVIPRVVGATPYVVLTSSMQPGLPPGTLVVTRPTSGKEIAAGDVVTYQVASGEPVFVTHRVVSVRYDGRGELSLLTRGDANPVPDEDVVREVQVRGELWYSVPYVGHFSDLFSPHERQLGIFVVAGVLLLYALVEFAGALRDRWSKVPHRERSHA